MKRNTKLLIDGIPYLLALLVLANIVRYSIWQYFHKWQLPRNFYEGHGHETSLYALYLMALYGYYLSWMLIVLWGGLFVYRAIRCKGEKVAGVVPGFLFLSCVLFLLYLTFVDQFFSDSF